MDSILRDINREKGKMQGDVENLYRHFDKLQSYVRDYIEQTTVEWARLIVSHPSSLLLIVETTRVLDEAGYAVYGNESEPIRFTTLSLASGEIWDQLIHPSQSQGVAGTEYHGLSMTDLEGKPNISEVWPEIVGKLEDCHVVVFGLDWSNQAVRSVYPTHILDRGFCLHNKAKEYYGEFYELSLERILAYQGIDRKREDLKDSRERIQMLAQVVRNFAEGKAKQSQESEDNLDDLDSHPF